MRRRLQLTCFISFAIGLTVAPGSLASTLCDFDGVCSSHIDAQHLSPPAPEILAGGPSGDFLRLVAAATPPLANTLSFDLTDPGTFDVVTADFDFRITPGVGRGDGFGFALLNTADHGDSGTLYGGWEEPDFAASLGIGFDIHQGPHDQSDSHVSVHFNGALQTEVATLPGLDLAPPGGLWIHARVVLRPGRKLSDVTVILTPMGGQPLTVIDRLRVDGFTPYEGRAHFGARAGGETADHDLDNILVAFQGPLPSTFSFSDADVTAVENGQSAYLNVIRTGSALAPATVDFVTNSGSAQTGFDYVAVSGTLSFAPGETVKGIAVPIVSDSNRESDESLKVALRAPSAGWSLGAPSVAVVTIVDDERPERVGAWSAPMDWPAVAVHMHLLPTGKVMFWPAHDPDHQHGGDDPYSWDPNTGAIEPLMMAGYDIFCSGHTIAGDGQLLVTGGHIDTGVGLPYASLYDPFGDQWSSLPDMNDGRWYPTNTTLGNGDVLVTAGTVEFKVMNCVPQIWEMGNSSWRTLTDAVLCEPFLGQYYPFNYLLPNGRVFSAGPHSFTHSLDTTGTGSWAPVARTNQGYREYGSSAMYSPRRIVIAGGNEADLSDPPRILPSRTAEVIDLKAATPSWRGVSAMKFRRRQHNATLLPDGRLLVTGGSSSAGFNDAAGAVLAAEMWDPAADRWSALSAMQVPRLYHSTALLLPDGRVLSAGGGQPPATNGGTDNFNAEIYSPPYLFRGPRPLLALAPSDLAYGESFFVSSPDAARIKGVTLIRLSSVTHAFNQNQRITTLRFTRSSTGLRVQGPTSSKATPPGHYMLFLLDTKGVPSVAAIVRVARGPLALTAPPEGADVDCMPGAAPPTLEWEPDTYDRFRVQIAWDWDFVKGKRVTSGEALLFGSSWSVPPAVWSRACASGRPLFYLKVNGIDLDLPASDVRHEAWSDIVVVKVLR